MKKNILLVLLTALTQHVLAEIVIPPNTVNCIWQNSTFQYCTGFDGQKFSANLFWNRHFADGTYTAVFSDGLMYLPPGYLGSLIYEYNFINLPIKTSLSVILSSKGAYQIDPQNPAWINMEPDMYTCTTSNATACAVNLANSEESLAYEMSTDQLKTILQK